MIARKTLVFLSFMCRDIHIFRMYVASYKTLNGSTFFFSSFITIWNMHADKHHFLVLLSRVMIR